MMKPITRRKKPIRVIRHGSTFRLPPYPPQSIDPTTAFLMDQAKNQNELFKEMLTRKYSFSNKEDSGGVSIVLLQMVNKIDLSTWYGRVVFVLILLLLGTLVFLSVTKSLGLL